MQNPGLRTGRDFQTYDVGPGTPHCVWPLKAANDLEPGGTATRHLLVTLLATPAISKGSSRDGQFRVISPFSLTFGGKTRYMLPLFYAVRAPRASAS